MQRCILSSSMRGKNYPGSSLHTVGPYIGRVRATLARELVQSYSREGDVVWDPFCGSGTVPLEALLLGREAVAGDVNPYALALTRAKLHAPAEPERSIRYLRTVMQEIRSTCIREPESSEWVRSFFDERTFLETHALALRFRRDRRYFLLGCILGILHHQRPGFLSFPASNLVPYLRTKTFPRDRFPEAYEYRDPLPRLEAKVRRTLSFPAPASCSRFRVLDSSATKPYMSRGSVDCIITSPPYMGALDYCRDNRLRLWFLNVRDHEGIKRSELGPIASFDDNMRTVLANMAHALVQERQCILIIGNVKSCGKTIDLPSKLTEIIRNEFPQFELEDSRYEDLPAAKRSRKTGSATSREAVLVFRRSKEE